MKHGARRWLGVLLAGGALTSAGCGEHSTWGQPGHSPEIPRPAVSGQLSHGTRVGGTVEGIMGMGPRVPTGGPPGTVAAGLGTSLADAYTAGAPGKGSATGGSGTPGAPTPPGGAKGQPKPRAGAQQGHK